MNDELTGRTKGPVPGFLARMLPERGVIRTLTLAVLVNSLGSGLTLPVSTLYFTRIVGLPLPRVAATLGVAGLAGLFVGVLLGQLADRYSPRTLQAIQLAAMGALAFCYVTATSLWQYALITIGMRVLDRGVAAVGGAVVAGATNGPDRVRARSRTRVAMNIGLVLGTGVAGLSLQVNSASWYRVLLACDALSYLLTACVYLRLPRMAPSAGGQARPSRWRVFRDRGYLAVTLLLGCLGMNQAILIIAMPLWIATHTHAPRAMISVLIFVNTVGCVLFQIPTARTAEDVTGAVRAARLGGLSLFCCCAVFTVTAGRGPVPAVALLLLAGLLHLAGEMLVSASQFCLAFQLADERAQGQYQGAFSAGLSLTGSAAPTVMALLPLGLGTGGWLLLGAFFVLTSAGVGPVAAARQGLGVRTV